MLEETHPRKRRERKKKKQSECDYEVQEPRYYLRKHPVDKTGDHDNEDEDDDETNEDVDKFSTSHHERNESKTRWPTIVIFAITSTALVILTGIVFVELKGSHQVSTPIAESRYVNILSNFVEESNGVEEEHAAEVVSESHTVEGEEEDDSNDGGNSESQSDEDDGKDEEEEDGDEDEGDTDDLVDSAEPVDSDGREAVTEEQVQVPESRSDSEETDNKSDDGQVPSPAVGESYSNEESPSSETESRDEEIADNQDQQEPELLQRPIESTVGVEEDREIGGHKDDDTLDITNEYDSQIVRQLTEAELELDRELRFF